MSSLYILEIRPLSEVSLANMFCHMVGSHFILMLFSLAMQKLFNLMRSHLFILSFMSLALGDISVKMLLRGISEVFLPMFSSRTFMVSRLIFKAFIHLEFIFVYGVSWWSSYIFLHVAIQIKNISHDSIKVSEKNIGGKISDIPCSNIFTDTSPRARDIKERINKWDYIKLKTF